MVKLRKKKHLAALPPGHQLLWYEIKEILGQGGFGITYLALDQNLDHEVAIKEYMPSDIAVRSDSDMVEPITAKNEERYRWGLRKFIDEARTIGQFRHPNIVKVRNVFEANNTAYMVMDYELGETLQDILTRRKILSEADIKTVLYPIIDGIKTIHAHGFIHRDIKPANIFIRVDGEPVLLDFGSARQAMGESGDTITSIISKGYAPIEQYNAEQQELQGPWTDIYALGATLYRMISGIPPCDAINRSSAISITSRDTYVTASEIGEGRYSDILLQAIDFALQFRQQDRPQSISEWQAVLLPHADAGLAQDAAAKPADKAGDTFQSYLAKAQQNDPGAQATLAFMYAKGIAVEKNEAEAIRWYRLAAERGHINAQYNLGVIFAKGRGVPQDYDEALRWYRMAAEQGDATAQHTVAMMYQKGIGAEKNDAEALRWYQQAADQGHVNSMFKLGEIHTRGSGAARDYQLAFKWYMKAAELGHVNAQLNLGYMYGKGHGVERNDTEAYHWYRMAAESGHPIAQYNLGIIYSKGRGIPQNLNEAIKWFKKADDQGDENAKRSLEKLRLRIPAAALSE